jgi:ribosomal protein L14E/L6E/L27E
MKYTVAKSVAGHDKGSWYIIVRQEPGYAFIADGRRRKIGAPKRKNVKHIEITRKTVELAFDTDKSLRKALWKYNFGAAEVNTDNHESG